MSILLEPNVLIVLLGTFLLGCSSAVVGMFSFLAKKSLVGDALAHAVLPGICLAFIATGQKNPFFLIVGATISGWLALWSIDLISRKSKLKADTAIAIVLSVFFGLGMLLLTFIQQSGNAAQSGLDSFLFGKAASMTRMDVLVFGAFALLLLALVAAFYKEFKLITFNRDYAISIGLPVLFFDLVLATLNVLAVAIGIQAVGVVLMAALLITPAAAARFWSSSLQKLLLIAAAFGSASGLIGAMISLLAPAMPTGPWIVVVLSIFALFSVCFAPKEGILARQKRDSLNREKIYRENILKIFYQLGEANDDFARMRNRAELNSLRTFHSDKFVKGLKQLQRQGYILQQGIDWQLSESGLQAASRVVRLHRLWELYLTQRLNLPNDHVHHDAEAIEHIITPELEALLLKDLAYPTKDPHNSSIPGH